MFFYELFDDLQRLEPPGKKLKSGFLITLSWYEQNETKI